MTTKRTLRLRSVAVLASALALGLAGCGEDSSPASYTLSTVQENGVEVVVGADHDPTEKTSVETCRVMKLGDFKKFSITKHTVNNPSEWAYEYTVLCAAAPGS